jgi:hypothetical protein
MMITAESSPTNKPAHTAATSRSSQVRGCALCPIARLSETPVDVDALKTERKRISQIAVKGGETDLSRCMGKLCAQGCAPSCMRRTSRILAIVINHQSIGKNLQSGGYPHPNSLNSGQ